ncbi:MAG: hypothetical protein HKN04_13540 [Rhodothermaceae bacterium]|nr:hypothetical protein [Rhodothermaceae bacterium]
MKRLAFLLTLLSVFASACTSDEAPSSPPALPIDTTAGVTYPVPYRFNAPDTAFAFPGSLREISGLTALGEGHLGAIQDEEGILFTLDRQTGRVQGERRFAEDGDYEGIEQVGEAVWVLKSNGALYEVNDSTSARSPSEAVNTALHDGCDAEGLAYEAARNRLLIACKERPGRRLGNVRAIYSFDLDTRSLDEEPAFLLNRGALNSEGQPFKPAALSIHPRTGQIFIISSVRKALAVLDPDGALVTVVDLPDRLFVQPEGLTFFPDGTLFIANESRRGAATLLRFNEQTP